jgi:NADH-quinone oxidoreductase subunit G
LVPVIKEVQKEVEKNRLFEISGVDESLQEKLAKLLVKKDTFTLILGEDLYNHKRAKNIAKLAGLIQKYSNFKVLIIPPKVNSLGVSLICDLDKEYDGFTVGYNTKADFILTSLGSKSDNELDMPALNQQEGTFTNIDKRVVPINPAISFEGYTLFEIAKELGVTNNKRYTIDFTKELPKEKGYQEKEFDELDNYYTRSGEEKRGYILEYKTSPTVIELEEIQDIDSFNGSVVYRCNPVLQFNRWSAKTTQLKTTQFLHGSKQFSIGAKINDLDTVEIEFDGQKLTRVFKIDKNLKGTIAFLDTFEDDDVIDDYRYKRAKITSLGSSK